MPNPVLHQLNVLGSVLSSQLGGWRGAAALPSVVHNPQPAQALRLYDMEGCPYCRVVREALSALHLDAQILPCPKGGTRFRPEAERMGGKALFPLLHDPNTNTLMYESADIVAYLFRTYAGRDVPKSFRDRQARPLLRTLASVVRGMRGLKARPSKAPAQPLELWSFEASPYARLVRERCVVQMEVVLEDRQALVVLLQVSVGLEHRKDDGVHVATEGPSIQLARNGIAAPGGGALHFSGRHQRAKVQQVRQGTLEQRHIACLAF